MDLFPEMPKEMRLRYLTRRKSDFQKLRSAVENKDVEVLKIIGHQLRGNAKNYGFEELAQLGQQFEEAGDTLDFTRAITTLLQFQSWIKSTELTLSAS